MILKQREPSIASTSGALPVSLTGGVGRALILRQEVKNAEEDKEVRQEKERDEVLIPRKMMANFAAVKGALDTAKAAISLRVPSCEMRKEALAGLDDILKKVQQAFARGDK